MAARSARGARGQDLEVERRAEVDRFAVDAACTCAGPFTSTDVAVHARPAAGGAGRVEDDDAEAADVEPGRVPGASG